MKIELIPAIDVIDGRCVRLTQGDFRTKKIYFNNPLEVAKALEGCGLKRLHVVDLDGAREGKVINYKTLNLIASHTSLVIDFGGGLKTGKDLEIAFENGAQMITGGSIAVKEPELFYQWLQRFGTDRIILGADAKDEKIVVSGWQETTTQELIPYIETFHQRGIQKVICTDISRDGMLEGPSTELYKKIRLALSGVYLIASGGIGSVRDFEMLDEAGIPAVIFGKAIYEGRIKLQDLEKLNS